MQESQCQIRGWKDIAASIDTSVRTARRWERTRGLPVRRHAGVDRDAVFVLRVDLSAWLTGNNARSVAPDGDSDSDERTAGRVDVQEEPGAVNERMPIDVDTRVGVRQTTPNRRWNRRLTVLVAGLGAVGILAAVVAFSSPTWRSASPRSSAAVRVRTVNLRISRPDGWEVRMVIADGGAGQFGGLPGRPAVILRPHLLPEGLMVEVGRVDGLSVHDRPGAPGPLVLLLERGVTVGARLPFRFDIEWTGGPGEPAP